MSMKMSAVPVDRIFVDSRAPGMTGQNEFTIDCGAVYFGAVYGEDGGLMSVDQYFYTEDFSRDDMEEALADTDLIFVDSGDFPVKTYLLTKEEEGTEWLRFHAVIPDRINPAYFRHKYIGE